MPNMQQNGRIAMYIKYALIALAIVLVVLVIFFIAQYRALRREQIANGRASLLSALRAHHGPLGASSVGDVRSWMTFQYINYLFNVPPAYLQAQLDISNPGYPRMTISGYAKSAHLDVTTFTDRIESALQRYLTGAGASTSTAPSTSGSSPGAGGTASTSKTT